ncbi:hypothetical protein [Paranoxybacillus vitaminiphilus]|nr:hypothetical protein [Anoxybacillus vitaminiphilus]
MQIKGEHIQSHDHYGDCRVLFLPKKEWDDESEMERTIQFLMHGLTKK